MYRPAFTKEESQDILHAMISSLDLATVIVARDGDIEANPFPFILKPEIGAKGAICGHMAKANSLVSFAIASKRALATFLGPAYYVTPSWYPTKTETGKVVPTYNYVAVHCYGSIEIKDDPLWLKRHLADLTGKYENGQNPAWKISDAPEPYIEAQIKGIVGFELKIDRLEGKWKLSQNKSEADQMGVLAGLRDRKEVGLFNLTEQAIHKNV